MILFIYRNHFSKKIFSLVLLVIAFGEMSINSYYLILGIRNDWVYASRSLYTDPYPAISALVGYTKQHNQDFYRLEISILSRLMMLFITTMLGLAYFHLCVIVTLLAI